MPKIYQPRPGEVIYRRARQRDFADEPLEVGIWSPLPSLFEPTKDGDGLSIFLAEWTTPFRVLLHHVKTHEELLKVGTDKEKKRAAKMLAGAENVEQMYDNGWRIVEVPADAFPPNRFFFDGPDEDGILRGHCNVCGSLDDFRLNSLSVRTHNQLRLLDRLECLDSIILPAI